MIITQINSHTDLVILPLSSCNDLQLAYSKGVLVELKNNGIWNNYDIAINIINTK